MSMHVSIDGKWVPCRHTDDFGYLGSRVICDLGGSGTETKKLLLRFLSWPASSGSEVKLGKHTILATLTPKLRPVISKRYRFRTQEPGQDLRIVEYEVVQQDVSDLRSLRQAITEAAQAGKPEKVQQLFYNCVKALNEYGSSMKLPPGTPLQLPQTLAVAPNGRVALLDGELGVAGPVPHPDASQVYASWFGDGGKGGYARDSEQASVLHAHALRRYFGWILGTLGQSGGPIERQVTQKVATQLGTLQNQRSLDDLESFIENNAEDWNIYVEDEPIAPPELSIPPHPRQGFTAGRPSKTQLVDKETQPQRSFLARASLWLNLLLIVAIILLLLFLRPKDSGTAKETENAGTKPNDPKQPVTAASDLTGLLFSTYCVVFPVQGTVEENVEKTLKQDFPDKVQNAPRSADEREKLLTGKLQQAVESIEKRPELLGLLARLDKQHITFKGLRDSTGDDALKAIVRRTSVFSTGSAAGQQQHGSLLQVDGLSKVLDKGALTQDKEAQTLLGALKRATGEYASLVDALNAAGNRAALLVQVEPTSEAHEKLRKRLLSRLEQPVFISRPLSQLYDAVDPTADKGGGFASYSLKLSRSCYWRQISTNDRVGANAAFNSVKDKMKWQEFPRDVEITWEPQTVRVVGRGNIKSDTFDIAVFVSGKVVVFRNQAMASANSETEVRGFCKDNIKTGLGLTLTSPDDAMILRREGRQHTGVLQYSFLADAALGQDKTINGANVQILTPELFEKQREGENATTEKIEELK